MITDLNDLQAAIGLTDEPPIDNKLRFGWNKYVDWLEKRGMKGHPSLDKKNLGKNLLLQFAKENPQYGLSADSVIPIQNELAKYRQWSLGQIAQGKGAFAPGTNEENYLHDLSIVDGIPGQRTTSYKFPEAYLQTFEDGKLMKTESKGIINTANPVIPK